LVARAIRAVKQRFSSQVVQEIPKRRLLVVIRTSDGDLILQKKQDDHQSGQRYTAEARTLLQSFFPKKPEKFSAVQKADDAIYQTLDFRRVGDMYTKGHFERDGVEWHPVLLDIHWLFDTQTILSMAEEGEGLGNRILTPIGEHQFAAKLEKMFPLPKAP
jgi:hypothetical protein